MMYMFTCIIMYVVVYCGSKGTYNVMYVTPPLNLSIEVHHCVDDGEHLWRQGGGEGEGGGGKHKNQLLLSADQG